MGRPPPCGNDNFTGLTTTCFQLSGPKATIGAAINAAADGDHVVVAHGTYCESIDFMGKAITVRSNDPTDPAVVAATIIDGGGVEFHVVKCVTGEGPDTVLNGFTITGGFANGPASEPLAPPHPARPRLPRARWRRRRE